MDCIQPKLGLDKQSFVNAGTAAVATSQDFTTPTDRGDGYAMDLSVASSTVADLALITITVTVNGIVIFQNVPALDYSPLNAGFNKDTRAYIPFPSGVVVTTVVTNGSASAVKVFTNLYMRQTLKRNDLLPNQ